MKNKIRKAGLVVFTAMASFFLIPSVVASAATPPEPVITNEQTQTLAQVSLSALTVTIIISLLIPIVVGIITKYSVPSYIKGLITLVLNAVNALLTTALVADGTAVISKPTFIAWFLGLAISVATYAGVYKPLGVTSTPNPDGKALLAGKPPQ